MKVNVQAVERGSDTTAVAVLRRSLWLPEGDNAGHTAVPAERQHMTQHLAQSDG